MENIERGAEQGVQQDEQGFEQGVERDLTSGQQGNYGGQQQGNQGESFSGMEDQVADGMVNQGMCLSPIPRVVAVLSCLLVLSPCCGTARATCPNELHANIDMYRGRQACWRCRCS